jgi:hypothetical protein
MKKIISALLLYDLNKDMLDALQDEDVSNVDLNEPVIINKAGVILRNEKPLIKVLQSKDLVNVYYRLEEEL